MSHRLGSISPQNILKAIPLFKNLDDEDLELIAARLRKEHYPKGAMVFKQGDVGDKLYLVESGQVQVVSQDQSEAIARMGPGNFVGDIALLLDQPRTASLEVTIDAQLWALSKDDFDRIIDTRPSIALEMMRELSRRLVTTTRRRRQVVQRRITALTGVGKGVELSQAIYTQLKSPVALLLLPKARATGRVANSQGVMVVDSEDLTEDTLAEMLSHQIEVFKHVVLLLPDQPNALVQKAIDLADTVISIGKPPDWLAGINNDPEMWVIEDSEVGLSRTARRLTNRTVGLALSSGGAKGLAHIGVLKVLAEEGIAIDMIAGASAGALFGGLYAAGWSNEQILNYIQRLKLLTRLPNWDFNIPRLTMTGIKVFDIPIPLLVPYLTGIVKGRKARNRFLDRPLKGKTFTDLDVPLYIVAADILTGEEVIFGPDSDTINSSLADAIRSSVSIPVLPDPWQIAGHYLVDGGLVNPLPASVLRERGADIVIASNVVQPLKEAYAGSREKMPNLLQTITNIFSAMEAEMIKKQLPLIDVVIHHQVSAKHTFDFDRAEDLIRIGEETARQMLPVIQQVIESATES
jgi:NTE family protein